eukprot:8739555-Ditylum_brightwellii.AAC.1
MLIPSMGYSFPASYFTKEELRKFEAICMPTVQQKSGYNKGYTRALVYCSKKLLGTGYQHLHAVHIYAR